MSTDPFGNPAPATTRQQPQAVRVLRLVGIAEITLGLVLLIVGFAIGETIIALIGGVLVASAGTLFVMVKQIAKRTG